ncbi:hypothetical protein PV327_003935 [Microctonus hyperodae]|uniref:Coiled-coil-helix-coiled-coil-helix domain-containing protein 7 n=1 Tax=Microctonus hyperodae TaxID=165561 RepID=A0AA39G5W8_MICHY|nr:hypothetical protein PV327_003935 [Microctonus hyperodae]
MSVSEIFKDATYSSENANPCMKERLLSLKCLDENNYKQEACKLYFDNYKNCNKFWKEVYFTRRQQGISPYLPEPEERAKIKDEYLKSMKK